MKYNLIIGAPLNPEQSNKIQLIIELTFQRMNALFTTDWNPDSELSKLNSLAAHQKVAISAEFELLLQITDKIVHLTRGKFDPTILPLRNLWKSKLSMGLTPTEEEMKSVGKSVGWNKIHFENGYFWKDEAETALDFGGIAKGYAVDALIESLYKAGYSDVFVEWGGEIRACGKHPSNRPWTIYISRFEDSDPANALAIVPLQDQAMATSGDYLQNWRIGEGNQIETYFHIINPTTFQSLKISIHSIASASVLAPNCALADGLATALMMFETIEEANQWIAEIRIHEPSLKFWLSTR